MKREKISDNVIRRLSMYLRKLDELTGRGVERISSSELGSQMGLTPSQIRQDLSCFGEFGQQGLGYRVPELREQLARILGMEEGFSVVVVGVGHIGHALIENMKFDILHFKLTAAFDVSEDKIGTQVGEITVYDSRRMTGWLRDNPTDIAVLCVPQDIANEVANSIAECGVKGIWNFTNTDIELNTDGVLIENIHFSDSLLTLSYYLAKSKRDGLAAE